MQGNRIFRKGKNLTLILTIMINTLILHQSSEARMIPGKEQANFYHQGVLKSFNHLDVNEKIQRFPGRSGRTNKAIKMRPRKWFLDPVVLKLANVIDKYDEEKGSIKTIYSGVRECGLNKCEKFHELIPENQTMGHVRCFKDNFKKKILNKLLKFHRGVQIIKRSFELLIHFENTSRFCNRSRRTLLRELEIDIAMLNEEVKSVMTDKRLNSSQESATFSASSIPRPDSETHLIINEWRIIQDSKQFLQDWQKNFKKIFKCWKKRKQKKKKEKEILAQKFESIPLNHHPQPTRIPRKVNLEKFSTFFFQKNNF